SHPQYRLFDRLVNPGLGKGGIFDLDLETSERANALLELLQNRDHFGMIAVSLGYFETLMSVSASSTSSEMSEEEQEKAHISPGLVRVSVGYTGTIEQRWSELVDALEQLS
ncbi:MAG TPA: PLP-dependent transferase, partial [Candidatus Eisenbacteria bacterium]|nr:PLP-dependent transferase [Candidatus Eisenbacteria bacterium]